MSGGAPVSPIALRPQQNSCDASAQVWRTPAAIAATFAIVLTRTGEDRSSPKAAPAPNSPVEFHPQQNALPSVAVAQVWNSPAEIDLNFCALATSAGRMLATVLPLPSCP